MQRIGIIGAGAWGTALAMTARRAGREVVLQAREREVVAGINDDHENFLFLPGIKLDTAIRAVHEPAEACEADAVFLVTPAQHLRAMATTIAGHLPAGLPVVICSKGIERKSCLLMSEVAVETLPRATLAALSGPTFAAEVAEGLPTAVTLACGDPATGQALVAALGTRTFRPYLTDDLTGVEMGGAVKNVLAIACGVVVGRRMGENARAALITRGLAEMARLGEAKGAKTATMMGLSGLGDLTLTCTGSQSRNMSLGIALGQGQTMDEALSGRLSVAEGAFSAIPVTDLARRMGVEMPICEAVRGILYDGESIDTVIEALLARPLGVERRDDDATGATA